MPLPSGPIAQLLGFILCRLLVPLWVLTGALFKLTEHTPRLLPQNILYVFVKTMGMDSYALLAMLIALELLAVGVMLFVGRIARVMAILMLGAFVAILISEIAAGHTSCGCFGSRSPNIWLMLGIDASLLLGSVLFVPGAPAPDTRRAVWPIPAAAAFAVLGAIASLAVVIPAGKAPPPPSTGGGESRGGGGGALTPVSVDHCAVAAGTTTNPGPRPLPGSWLTPSDVGQWVGKRWCELDIFQFMERWPSGLDGPRRYVVFYSRTCDHCEEMFAFDLATDDALAALVAAVEVPASKTERIDGGAWEMPPTRCELLELPLGCDYILTTPLVLRIEKGVIACAQEGGHAECMELE
jgi:hypothetical protein